MSGFQIQLFDRLIALYPKKSDAVQSFEDILNIGKDGVYRRIRGETLLTPEELVKLAKVHQISLDQMIGHQQNDVLFHFNSFSNKINTFEDFIDTLVQTAQQLHYVHHGQVLYASSEVPIYYQTIVPNFFSFKLYVWARTVWNFNQFENIAFDFSLIPKSVHLKCKMAFEAYQQLPSIELWSSGIFENTFSQINHHLDYQKFIHPSIALKLIDDLELLCKHMSEMAAVGKKYLPGNSPETGSDFTLYHNEMIYTNNTILFVSPELKVLFSTLCNPNFIVSRDRRIVDFMDQWFQTVKNKSILISRINDKERNRFFDSIARKIDIMRKKVELKVLEYDA